MKPKKKKPKKREPVTSVKLSSKERKEIISKVHQINKKKSLITNAADISQAEKQAQSSQLDAQISQLGGLNAYQFVSKTTESKYGGFNTAKWVIQQLKQHGAFPKTKPSPDARLQLLDVGALSLNYEHVSHYIQPTAIDLNPQHPKIIQADLLKYKPGEHEVYDVVVLSLVLNFAGDPSVRGNIWSRGCLLCKPGGHIVTVLPLPCVDNSRYLNEEVYLNLSKSLNLTLISTHRSKKLIFHMFKKEPPNQKVDSSIPTHTKKQVRNGDGLNNFCILLSTKNKLKS